MTKTKATKQLENELWDFTHQKLGVYGCFEVTMGLGMANDHREIADYITYDKQGVLRSYELKTTFADFKSHARLSWWGNYNYLVTTDEVWQQIKEQKLNYFGIGVYVSTGGFLKCVHKPSKHEVTVGERVTVIESMVRSMDRELKKLYVKQPY